MTRTVRLMWVKACDRATRRGREVEVHGTVIAELSFGFWRYLVASRYLTALWIPGARAAIPHGLPACVCDAARWSVGCTT